MSRDVLTEVYMSVIEGNPFEKGLSLKLPSENFQFKFKTHRKNLWVLNLY